MSSDYTAFASIMLEKYPSYRWEPLNVLSASESGKTTLGQYELTNFKLWNE